MLRLLAGLDHVAARLAKNAKIPSESGQQQFWAEGPASFGSKQFKQVQLKTKVGEQYGRPMRHMVRFLKPCLIPDIVHLPQRAVATEQAHQANYTSHKKDSQVLQSVHLSF